MEKQNTYVQFVSYLVASFVYSLFGPFDEKLRLDNPGKELHDIFSLYTDEQLRRHMIVYENQERYEACSLIRDELLKRKNND